MPDDAARWSRDAQPWYEHFLHRELRARFEAESPQDEEERERAGRSHAITRRRPAQPAELLADRLLRHAYGCGDLAMALALRAYVRRSGIESGNATSPHREVGMPPG
jgi:hypothetical protein